MGDGANGTEFSQCLLGRLGSETMAVTSFAAKIEDSSTACHVLQINETIFIQTHL